MKKNRAVFLDRDGTICEEVGYIDSIERLHLIPRSAAAIKLLNERGFRVVMVTNQSGVARGFFPEAFLEELHAELRRRLREEGAYLDGIYYCPHHPDIGDPPYRQRCRCRKPATGLVEDAVKELGLDCSQSYMIGDRGNDIEFGHQIGAKGVLVLTGYGKGEWEYCRDRWKVKPDHVAPDLYGAVQWILKEEGKRE